MSDPADPYAIYIDRDNIEKRIGELVKQVDEVDSALTVMPSVPDGGAASSMIALITASAAEAAGFFADSNRALGAITIDVMKDASLKEAEIEGIFTDLDKQMGER